MTATLQLIRTWAYLTDRGKWQILIDGTAAGSIDRKETVELPVERGRHTLRVKGSGQFGSLNGPSTPLTSRRSAFSATARDTGR
jgi:hypothetical protein